SASADFSALQLLGYAKRTLTIEVWIESTRQVVVEATRVRGDSVNASGHATGAVVPGLSAGSAGRTPASRPSVNDISTMRATRTGAPSFMPGRNRHCLSVLTAASSSPYTGSSERVTRTGPTDPSSSTTHSMTTRP